MGLATDWLLKCMVAKCMQFVTLYMWPFCKCRERGCSWQGCWQCPAHCGYWMNPLWALMLRYLPCSIFLVLKVLQNLSPIVTVALHCIVTIVPVLPALVLNYNLKLVTTWNQRIHHSFVIIINAKGWGVGWSGGGNIGGADRPASAPRRHCASGYSCPDQSSWCPCLEIAPKVICPS